MIICSTLLWEGCEPLTPLGTQENSIVPMVYPRLLPSFVRDVFLAGTDDEICALKKFPVLL